jgi:16S rRNA (cytidine1402-2'-O)-methyltransferase
MDKIVQKGILYLIPSMLGEGVIEHSIPFYNMEIIKSLTFFIVEEIRTARRFIKKISPDFEIENAQFLIFNEHTKNEDISVFIAPLLEGINIGILSEAGMPCVADPGSQIVASAHEKGIRVVPLTGPSSIFLSLMASGFNGQNFVFHGYLPIEKANRIKKIKEIEKTVYSNDQTQIFIETPYRNQQLYQSLLETCNNSTLLCIACDLTTQDEFIKIKTIHQWKGSKPEINKRQCVFLLYKS